MELKHTIFRPEKYETPEQMGTAVLTHPGTIDYDVDANPGGYQAGDLHRLMKGDRNLYDIVQGEDYTKIGIAGKNTDNAKMVYVILLW